jgi:YVTN family beta-propeller protein
MLNHASKLFAIAAIAAAISSSAAAQTVTKTLTLPNSSFGGIVANPLTNRIYAVSNSGSATADDTVSVIDGRTDSIIASIPVPSGAYVPAVNTLTNKIYVANCNFFLTPSPCVVTVIDGKTNTVVTNIPVTTVLNGFLAGITVNPLTNTIYVSDNTNQDIVVIDGKTNTVTGTISVSGTPWELAINSFTNQLYVTLGTSTLDIINVVNKDILPVSTGAGTIGFNVAVDWLTGHVLVTNTQAGASSTAILDHDGKILAQVEGGQGAYGVDVDPLSELAFVADNNDNNTSVINTRTKTLKGTIVGTFGSFVSVNPVTRKVYSIGGAGTVTVATE